MGVLIDHVSLTNCNHYCPPATNQTDDFSNRARIVRVKFAPLMQEIIAILSSSGSSTQTDNATLSLEPRGILPPGPSTGLQDSRVIVSQAHSFESEDDEGTLPPSLISERKKYRVQAKLMEMLDGDMGGDNASLYSNFADTVSEDYTIKEGSNYLTIIRTQPKNAPIKTTETSVNTPTVAEPSLLGFPGIQYCRCLRIVFGS